MRRKHCSFSILYCFYVSFVLCQVKEWVRWNEVPSAKEQNNCLNTFSIGIPFLLFLTLPKYFSTKEYIPTFERYLENSASPALSHGVSDVFSILSILISYVFFCLDFLSFLIINISPQYDSALSPSKCEHYLF